MNTYKVKANDNTGFWEIHDVSGFVSKTESESTAQLFAAAPDLLEALERLIIQEDWAGEEETARDLVFAAIKKAKGE